MIDSEYLLLESAFKSPSQINLKTANTHFQQTSKIVHTISSFDALSNDESSEELSKDESSEELITKESIQELSENESSDEMSAFNSPLFKNRSTSQFKMKKPVKNESITPIRQRLIITTPLKKSNCKLATDNQRVPATIKVSIPSQCASEANISLNGKDSKIQTPLKINHVKDLSLNNKRDQFASDTNIESKFVETKIQIPIKNDTPIKGTPSTFFISILTLSRVPNFE